MVSIIMPAYNCAKYIGDSIESVLAQTYTNWELLITDDCSTDDTVEIIKRYAEQDNRIKLFIQERNGGAGLARNNSIEKAKGRYIAFLDSDDWWYPNKISLQLHFMNENNYEFTFTDYEICDNSLNVKGVSLKPKRISYRKMCQDNNVGTPGVIYDTIRIGKIYMPTIKKGQDWVLWIKLVKETKYAYALNKCLWKYRNVENSLSKNKFSRSMYNIRIYREELKMSLFGAWMKFIFVFIPQFIIKKIKVRMDSRVYKKKLRK